MHVRRAILLTPLLSLAFLIGCGPDLEKMKDEAQHALSVGDFSQSREVSTRALERLPESEKRLAWSLERIRLEALAREGIQPIDLVAVNLYPFRQTVAKPSVTLAEAVEQIDIGGPTLLRAAAKNHRDVVVTCDPADYDRVIALLDAEAEGEENGDHRRRLAARVFAHTAAYDAAVASYLRSFGREHSGLEAMHGMLIAWIQVRPDGFAVSNGADACQLASGDVFLPLK